MDPATDPDPWEYRVETFLNVEVERMRNDLNWLGAQGWELVSLSTTVKKVALAGNDMVAVFKRRGRGYFVEPKDHNAVLGLEEAQTLIRRRRVGGSGVG